MQASPDVFSEILIFSRHVFGLQEAYVKGVSSWNFDVAALKAEAEADNEPLPTIPETSYDPASINAPRGISLTMPASSVMHLVPGLTVGFEAV